MQIIQERRKVSNITYSLDFDYRGRNDGSGFSFDCTKDGVCISHNDVVAENYQKCLNGTYDVIPQGIRTHEDTYMENAIGICEVCDREIELRSEYCGACECECGQWYNLSGQALMPPELWEEPINYEY